MQDFIPTLVSEAKGDALPEEYDYFGRLIGSWELDYIDHNTSRTVKGEWHFARILEGMEYRMSLSCPRSTREPQPLILTKSTGRRFASTVPARLGYRLLLHGKSHASKR